MSEYSSVDKWIENRRTAQPLASSLILCSLLEGSSSSLNFPTLNTHTYITVVERGRTHTLSFGIRHWRCKFALPLISSFSVCFLSSRLSLPNTVAAKFCILSSFHISIFSIGHESAMNLGISHIVEVLLRQWGKQIETGYCSKVGCFMPNFERTKEQTFVPFLSLVFHACKYVRDRERKASRPFLLWRNVWR